MSTKAEQFGSKIRYLQEYHNRVLHNIYPVPSGTDIANTLKYFSQTLLSVLRDAPADRGGATQQSREVQISDYPSLDYQGLYATLVTLLDLVPLLQHGQHDTHEMQ
ncbi:protein unc-79 homolog [Sinocyclocheilus anshuiensis]|uniref:protein unc-79 homolog n=1 Tax=Sinocyclocheilus anshuiensis TaxID=1608454 RepID=UPI0007B91460|nr:PREDICTED: protein unc-79 homolog [Sinocyclocheilus anshuiensis]